MILQTPAPLFDSVHKTLSFAFNQHDAYIAPSVMTRMMAQTNLKPTKKLKKARQRAGLVDPQEETKRSPSRPVQPGDILKGLEKAAQAGFILHQVQRLELVHQGILAARLTRPRDTCECKMPCCQGWRPNVRWSQAISALCAVVKESGNVLRVPGKKGFSTSPELRRLIVERHFSLTPLAYVVLALKVHMHAVTVAMHAKWIDAYLTQNETEAWLQIAQILDQGGLTGFIE